MHKLHIQKLIPDSVFCGKQMRTGCWGVLIKGGHIKAVGEPFTTKLSPGVKIIDLACTTLMPGLIEGHLYLFLHPYNETSWNGQMQVESRAERTARDLNHARESLMIGFN